MNVFFRPAGDVLADLDRLQRYFDQASRFREPSDIRAQAGATFPVINVGSTTETVEVLALAPGLDAKTLEITIDKGLLTIAGERKSDLPQIAERGNVYANERFSGGFRRVINLSDDVDPSKVQANYVNGLLRVTLPKRESSKPRRISIN